MPQLLSPTTFKPCLGFRTHFIQRRCGPSMGVVMRDRSKNRKPTQRGRHLTTEAIQAVQALKRAAFNGEGEVVSRVQVVVERKVKRLVKWDMVAVLRELIDQKQPTLALVVFEEVRKEHWYKPQLSLYADMIKVLAEHGLNDQVEHICSSLMMEQLGPDTEGFNFVLKMLLEFDFIQTAMSCFRLMKLWESEPDESTYKLLISSLDSKGEMDLCADIRQEAEKQFGEELYFLEENEEVTRDLDLKASYI